MWLMKYILICVEVVCTSTHLQAHTYKHTLTSTHLAHTYKHTLTSIHLQAYTYKHTLTSTHLQAHTYKHTLTSIHLQAYTYKHTCTHWHDRHWCILSVNHMATRCVNVWPVVDSQTLTRSTPSVSRMGDELAAVKN